MVIIEKSNNLLSKVKISGGGRCNVTHACFEPKELIKYYPRGKKELLGPFHNFMTGDVFEWFSERSIDLKIEDDNRVFPVSDNSQTIIDCFLKEAEKLGININTQEGLVDLKFVKNCWQVITTSKQYKADKILIASGSSKIVWNLLKKIGHTIVNPVPSLFTFNIQDHRIKDIPGVVVKNCMVSIPKHNLSSSGPVLITHWGLSAPAILKLSAWGAKELAEDQYQFKIKINWTNSFTDIDENLKEIKEKNPKQKVINTNMFDIPKRLWSKLCIKSGISQQNWGDLSNHNIALLEEQLTQCEFTVNGKSTFKDEFVTAGGVELSEINFKRFESRLFSNLFFAGEVLNIDAVTGGFNFQAAWTGAWIAAKAMSE